MNLEYNGWLAKQVAKAQEDVSHQRLITFEEVKNKIRQGRTEREFHSTKKTA